MKNKLSAIGGTDGFSMPPLLAVGPVIRQAPTNLSFIEDHEEPVVQKMIDDDFRALTKCDEYPDGLTFREHARMTRYFAAIKIYVRPEDFKVLTDVTTGEKKTLYLPDSVRAEDKYQSCTGLVIGLGPDAFTNKDGTPRGSRYRVGDWVLFPRPDIVRVDFHDTPIGLLTDDRAVIVTDDPRHWTPGAFKYKV